MGGTRRSKWVSCARLMGVPAAAGPVQRVAGVLAFIALTSAMLWPLTFAAGTDSFPLSSFPMFATARNPILEAVSVHAVLPSGERARLPPGLAAGTPEVLQARALIHRAVTTNRQTMEVLCRKALTRSQSAWKLPPIAVELRYERYDARAYYRGQREPLKEKLLHCCADQTDTCSGSNAAQPSPLSEHSPRSGGAARPAQASQGSASRGNV